MNRDLVYMDYAAATPLAPTVLQAMQPFFSERFYNPSALYLPAKAVREDIQTARRQVASVLGARPAEIVFTAGATEANNLAIQGVMEQYPDGNIVVSAIEHDSVLAPAAIYDCRQTSVNPRGIVDLAELRKSIDDQTVLVSIMYANNEVGTIQPIKDIAALIAEVRTERKSKGNGNGRPIYLHSDAAQAANYLDLHVSRLGVDLLSLNGGKIYGPKQSGVLYVAAGLPLTAQVRGGGQEMNLRSGTENVAGIIGLATALQQTQELRHDEVRRLQTLQSSFIKGLQERLPSATINGSTDKRLPNNVHVTFPGVDNERLLFQLEERGILAAAGSACSASNDEPSHVLKALGLSDSEAQNSLRFTLGRASTMEHVEFAVATLAELVA